MKIDSSKLKKMTVKPDGNQVSQCPACAAEGHDKKGEHLFIAPDGKFGCIKHPDDREHNKEILRLAGAGDSSAPVKRQVTLTVLPYRISKPRVISTIPRWTLDELAGDNQAESVIAN